MKNESPTPDGKDKVKILADFVAHEINNQLTPIHGYVELLLQQLPPGSDVREMLVEIDHCAQRCADVARHLVEYSRGAGDTTFNAKLESSAVMKRQRPSANTDVMPSGNETILFVDDEERIRTIGKTLLERLGYTVIIAGDGREAIEIYHDRKKDIHAVILDMTMPHLTGGQVMKKLLEDNPAIKIILASGSTAEGSPEELVRAGAKEFVQKPYTINSLAMSLRRALDAA